MIISYIHVQFNISSLVCTISATSFFFQTFLHSIFFMFVSFTCFTFYFLCLAYFGLYIFLEQLTRINCLFFLFQNTYSAHFFLLLLLLLLATGKRSKALVASCDCDAMLFNSHF